MIATLTWYVAVFVSVMKRGIEPTFFAAAALMMIALVLSWRRTHILFPIFSVGMLLPLLLLAVWVFDRGGLTLFLYTGAITGIVALHAVRPLGWRFAGRVFLLSNAALLAFGGLILGGLEQSMYGWSRWSWVGEPYYLNAYILSTRTAQTTGKVFLGASVLLALIAVFGFQRRSRTSITDASAAR